MNIYFRNKTFFVIIFVSTLAVLVGLILANSLNLNSRHTNLVPLITPTQNAQITVPSVEPTAIEQPVKALNETPQTIFPPGEFLIQQSNPLGMILSSTDGKLQQEVLDFIPPRASISHDGRKLAYLSNGIIYIKDLVSQQMSQINDETSGNLGGSMAWSPDGTQLGYGCWSETTQHKELCLLNIFNGEKKEVTNFEKLGIQSFSSLDGVEIGNWSADSTEVVFITRVTTGDGAQAWGIIQIYRPNDGTIQTVIDERSVSTPKYLVFPSLSPDGDSILFKAKSGDHYEIYRIKSDGSNLESLTANYSFNISNPIWDPAGRYFVASAPDQQNQENKDVPTIFSSEGKLMYQPDVDGLAISWIGN